VESDGLISEVHAGSEKGSGATARRRQIPQTAKLCGLFSEDRRFRRSESRNRQRRGLLKQAPAGAQLADKTDIPMAQKFPAGATLAAGIESKGDGYVQSNQDQKR